MTLYVERWRMETCVYVHVLRLSASVHICLRHDFFLSVFRCKCVYVCVRECVLLCKATESFSLCTASIVGDRAPAIMMVVFVNKAKFSQCVRNWI